MVTNANGDNSLSLAVDKDVEKDVVPNVSHIAHEVDYLFACGWRIVGKLLQLVDHQFLEF